MAAYFVFGTLVVLFALGLAAVGLTRAGYPPTIGVGRRLMAAAGVLVISTFVALVVTTKREHPREEAKAEAVEKAKAKPEQEAGAPVARKGVGGGTLSVSEKEYSVDLAGGEALKAGKYTIDVANKGKIQHDIAVEGDGIKEAKTPLIDAGKNASLKVDLKPGKYKLYCTVPGHEQLGMKTEVTVR
jgi:uncharacterized cupredoxin-like copper-binding protein